MYCEALEEQLRDFYDDPITVAYGANDCDGIVIEKHLKTGCLECLEILREAQTL